MDADTLGLLVPIIAVCIPIVVIWTRYKTRIAEMQVGATAEKAAQYATQNHELEERVRVLERIVTDKGYDVGRQIDALRDTRVVESRIAATANDAGR
jgi:hypothetical protein